MKRSVGAPMNAKMDVKDLKRLGGGREVDRLAASAAAALAQTAADRGLLDVAVAEIDSPVGELLLAVTPRGLAYVAFEDEERDELLGRLSRQLSPGILERPAGDRRGPAPARRVFRRRPDTLRAEARSASDGGIARDVLAATAKVPFGKTTTYGTLAERIGRPRPPAPSATPWAPTRSRSWFRATASFAPVATWAAMPAARRGSAGSGGRGGDPGGFAPADACVSLHDRGDTPR